jgi:hypothetical protein
VVRRGLQIALAAVGICCIAAVARSAHASTVVIESYVGERPADANDYMAIMLDELAQRGKRVGVDEVGKPLEALHSRPAMSGDAAAVEELMPRLVESGYQAWVDGSYPTAIRDLSRAVEIARDASGAIIENKDRRMLVGSALVGLALANRRCGQSPVKCQLTDAEAAAALDAAQRWMTEVVGSFQESEIELANYGPEALDFYRKVRQSIRARSAGGTLIVNIDDAGAMIFVNEGYAGLGKATLSNVFLESCRVLVRKGANPGRVFRPSMVPGEPTRLHVSWAFEAALHTSPRWVGLRFTDEAARETHEVPYATRIARLVGADTVIVLAIRAEKGRRALVGAVYGADGTALPRTADIALEPIEPSAKRLRAMAAYLAGDIDRIPDDPVPAGRSRGRASQVVLGIGALAAVGSSVWYLASPDDDHTVPYEDRKTPAVAVFVGSSLALGTGVYLYLRTSKTGAATAAVLGAGVTTLLSGAMLYVTDEDPYSGPGAQRPYYRNTAPLGLIFGSAGVTLTGAGIWLLTRMPRDRSMPIVLVARTRGFIGWSTAF